MPKRKQLRLASLSALTAAGLIGLALPAPAMAAKPCMGTFEEQLSRLGVSQSDVESMTVMSNANSSGGAGGPYAVSHDAWVRLKTCQGYLVLRTSATCTYLGAYTTRDCQVSGVPQY